MTAEYRLDKIDKRILYHLVSNARNTSAPMIAEEVDVTPATIRHRIQQLEEHGIIRGYHADVDYERADGRVRTQFTCTATVEDRQRLAQEALQVPGVVGIRQLLSGRQNLLITVVGTGTEDVSRIEQELSELGLDVEQEDTIHSEIVQPYQPFAPDDGQQSVSLTDFRSLSGGAEVVEFTVGESAEIVGYSIEDAGEDGLLDGVLVVNIERGDEMLTPRGDTTIEAGDVVTMFGRSAIPQRTVRAFETASGKRSNR